MEQRNSSCKIKRNPGMIPARKMDRIFWPEFSPAHKDLDIHSLSACCLKLSHISEYMKQTNAYIHMFGFMTSLLTWISAATDL